MDCIFCKIAKGDVEAHKIYEDTHAVAFLDVKPHALGHTVVIPKVHAETLLELNEQLYHDFMVAVKISMERVLDVLHPDGFNVGWNHHEAGGQAIPHLHVHVLPRYHNDGGTNIHGIIDNPGKLSIEEVADKFKK